MILYKLILKLLYYSSGIYKFSPEQYTMLLALC
nr:MAG TPA: hypothetical protein [Caudoviricetes sp.]